LGLSEELTSLVWLAGPISGLVAQPLIGMISFVYLDIQVIYAASKGAVSDSSSSKYRRRFWVVLSTIALVMSTLTLAYCKEIAGFVVDLAGVGAGDWSEKRAERVSGAA